MKLIITLAILMVCCTSFAQQKNLSKMNEKARNSYLIKLAREVSDNFGPGWIQGNILTSVSPIQAFDGDTRAGMKKHIGRKFYKVTFIYDEETQKKVGWRYAAYVRIWEDSGEPIDVMFGNDYGRHFFDFPYKTWKRAGIEPDDKMPFEEMYIKGVLEPECMNALFGDMNTKVVVYVKPSEVEKFKAVYKGPVYSLPEQIDDDIDYLPLLEEGKVWTYLHYNDRTGKRYQFTRIIDGDTIIGGQAYKKIYDKVGGQYQYALREEGKKVYMVDDHYETESLLYDFSKEVGDYLFLKETGDANGTIMGWKVANVDTIDIDGVRFRRMKIIEYNSFYGDSEWWGGYWIEGIGSECLLESSFRLIGNYDDLISCQINGRVYTQQELLATGIDEVKTEKSKQKGQNSSVYNLYGQRINGLQKGLNIVDGKKVWVR